MRRTWAVLGLIFAIVWLSPTVAQASICRSVDNQEICIVSIKRSAKNYWEYRASVRVDGVTKPVQIYDCRNQITVAKNKVLEPFEQDGSAAVVCSFFKPPRDAFGVYRGKATGSRDITDLLPPSLRTP